MNHLITGCCCSFVYLTLTVSNVLHSCLMNERPSTQARHLLHRGGDASSNVVAQEAQ